MIAAASMTHGKGFHINPKNFNNLLSYIYNMHENIYKYIYLILTNLTKHIIYYKKIQ